MRKPLFSMQFLMRHFFDPRVRRLLAGLAFAAASHGCTSDDQRENSRTIKPPSVNVSRAAAAAMELLDTDDSGALDESELAACPGAFAARRRYDTDGDRQVSRAEFASHLASFYSGGIALMQVSCRVSYHQRPLAGADVRFVPEPFLADAIQGAVGTTDDRGVAVIAIPEENLPEDQRDIRAVQPGVYRVEIEHPSIRQLEKPLGHEVDPIARGAGEAVFDL